MCNPLLLLGTAAAGGTFAGMQMYKAQNRNKEKADNEAQKQINAANQAATEQITANKLANSVQSTEKLSQTEELKKKLASQKIPLNTGTTGLSVGNSLSTGLNLGGY